MIVVSTAVRIISEPVALTVHGPKNLCSYQPRQPITVLPFISFEEENELVSERLKATSYLAISAPQCSPAY